MITKESIPIECIFTPGAEADIPDGSYIYADKAYNDYLFEDQLKEFEIHLIAKRKVNSKRQLKKLRTEIGRHLGF